MRLGEQSREPFTERTGAIGRHKGEERAHFAKRGFLAGELGSFFRIQDAVRERTENRLSKRVSGNEIKVAHASGSVAGAGGWFD